jgi:hypothetical protein
MIDSQEKKTVVLLVSTGWGVRTFLQTDVLPRLLSQVNVVVFASPEIVTDLKQTLGGSVAVESLRTFDHMSGTYGRIYQKRNYYFRRLAYTRARQSKLERYRVTLKGRTRNLMRSYMLEGEARLFATPATVSSLAERERKAFYQEYGGVGYYEALLQKHKPDLVLSTVPHVAQEAPPVLVAQRLGIKTGCWVNSWDNLSTKSAYFAHYDFYFVWSNRMRWELLRYYPETLDKEITVTGVPHFDWYHSRDLILSREEFCASIGFDARRPIILYAMATPHLAPAESEVAKQLIRDLPKLKSPSKPQLILRLHPADSGERLLDRDFGDTVSVQLPGARGEGNLSRFYPSREENQKFVNSVYHADVVINLASTITIDAALCDRPVISVAFDADPHKRYQKWIDRYHYYYEHYQTVLQCGAAQIATSYEQLIAHIETYLQNPELDREGRKRLVELWCGNNDGCAAHRFADAVFDAMAGEKSESTRGFPTESYRAS